MGNLQLADLGVVAGEDVVSDGEAGVGGDHAVVRAGYGHAGPATSTKTGPRYEMRKDGGGDIIDIIDIIPSTYSRI